MHEQIQYYQNKKTALEHDIDSVKKTLLYFYFIRLVSFAGFVATLVMFFYFSNSIIFLSLTIVGLLIFLFAVKFDLKLAAREKILENKLQLILSELQFLNFKYAQCDKGEGHQHLNSHLAADFDLFGAGSLFQYLNRCVTKIGNKLFAESLCKLQLNKTTIFQKQQAIKELSEKQEFIQHFRAHGQMISEQGNEVESLKLWLNEEIGKQKMLHFLIIFIPLINMTCVALIIFHVLSVTALLIPVLLSLSIIYLNKNKINHAHAKLGRTAKTFEKYTKLISLIEKEKFDSEFLITLQQQFYSHNAKAGESLAKLFKLLNSFDFRYNVVVSLVLNSLFIFDIQVLCRLASWKEKHKTIVPRWFAELAEMDALISYAVFAFNNQCHVSYPRISDKDFIFQAKEMGHPLLSPNIRINNSLDFIGSPSIIIITGANMAGKSTFLRTMAVNLILAMNGAPVCAKEFEFTPCHIMSSIKIQDSLSNNESYFYAELLRIKEIINHIKTHPCTLIFFDEILRGTNTIDKQLGSLGLLEKLIAQKATVVIATHDLTLGELEKKYPECVKNHCFEVELSNNQLVFDYKLKNGVSQKLNASFLMKQMGIIE